jgi:signal transduction histidine kinase
VTDALHDTPRLLRLAGALSFALVAVPAAFQGVQQPQAFTWWVSGLAAFGVLFVWSISAPPAGRGWLLAVLAAEAAAVIVMVATQCRGSEGALLVLVALQLGRLLGRGPGLAWVGLQSLALFWAIQHHWSLRPAFLVTPPYLGFQVLAFLLVELLRREGQLRAEAARDAERLRIARELHDAVGHHLAALSLNLEAARRETPDSPALHTARDLVRCLLDDVEAAVTGLRLEAREDFAHALRALAAGIPSPRVHVEMADVDVGDARRAHVLLRCCQEIVTNAVKHARAANVWITIRGQDGLLLLEAHDDGGGGSGSGEGQGLLGMRARLAEVGGAVDFDTAPGAGFRVRARLPAGAA